LQVLIQSSDGYQIEPSVMLGIRQEPDGEGEAGQAPAAAAYRLLSLRLLTYMLWSARSKTSFTQLSASNLAMPQAQMDRPGANSLSV
jgi:hypothetical protein